MNISEAKAATVVINWLGSLRLHETTGDVTDDQLRTAVTALAASVEQELGVGRSEAEVAELLDRMLAAGAYEALLIDP